MIWMLLVLYYGLAKGAREICKKKGLYQNSVIEVLFFYTLLSFVMVIPDVPNAFGMTGRQYLYVAFKSFIIFIAWMCSFKAIRKLPISTMGILDLSRVLFSTLLGVIILQEVMTRYQIVGLVLVSVGLLMLPLHRAKTDNNGTESGLRPKYVILAMISCILNAVSGILDKVLMKDLNSSQLQFWYMLFLVLFYAAYIIVKKEKIRFKLLIKNYWIWLLSLLFITSDRALFIANGFPDSRVTMMTLIKQSGCIVTILGGKFIFKEKNIAYKLLCAVVIITGIVIAVF